MERVKQSLHLVIPRLLRYPIPDEQPRLPSTAFDRPGAKGRDRTNPEGSKRTRYLYAAIQHRGRIRVHAPFLGEGFFVCRAKGISTAFRQGRTERIRGS